MNAPRIPPPKILRWHLWSGVAVICFRIEMALGPLGGGIAKAKWLALDRAQAAHPNGQRRGGGV